MRRAFPEVYVFGPFRLDPDERLLIRDGQPISLTPKAFDVLVTLVQHHGHLVDKNDLLEKVWPDTAVEESNLAQNVFVLRKLLGTGTNGQSYIETVPKRGYRFIAPVELLAADETEIVIERQTRLQISQDAQSVAQSQSHIDSPPHLAASRVRRSLLGAMLALVTLIGILTVVWSVGLRTKTKPEPVTETRRINIERITTTGGARLAAVSGDGRYIAYVLDENRRRSVWTRDLRTGSQLQVVPPDDVDYWGLAFDRDSAYVFATVWEWDKTDASIIRVPVLGGNVIHVRESQGGTISFSPDGRFFAQIETSDRLANSRIVIYRTDGAVERTLAVRRDPEGFLGSFNNKPAWSSDGRLIAAAVIVGSPRGARSTLVTIDVETGAQSRLTQSDWASIGPVVWLPDRRIVFVARDEPTSSQAVWELLPTDDLTRPLTTDAMDYDALTTTNDGAVLVAVRTERAVAISTGPADGAGEYHQMNAEVGVPRQAHEFSWTPDGNLVYPSTAGGPLDLWLASPDGTVRRRLTADAARDFHPAVSPNGAEIVYASDRDGAIGLWRMGIDGRGAARVIDETGMRDVYPRWFPDGRALVFQRGYGWGETTRLAKVRLDDTKPELFTSRTSLRPIVAPDGRRVAFFQMDPVGWRLIVMSVDNGREIASFTPPRSSKSRAIRWTPDGGGIGYIDAPNGIDNIWVQPVDKGRAIQVTHFDSGSPIEFFDWSPDGQRLGITRETLTSDVVRIAGVN